MKKVIPSSKVRNILMQISNYEEISQESAAKASKLIREQVINVYKLDEYVKTLLAETTALIRSSASMLAPLLASAAVIMTFAILKSTVFITEQLSALSTAFGGQRVDLTLVDMTKVISPIFIEAIIGIYLVEMLIILSIFQTQISSGSDTFLIMKSIKSNMLSFLLYSFLLFAGFYFINNALFPTLTGTG
jgi:hypothetical protein